MKRKKGKFIAVEGGEGSGKSTLIAMVRELYPEILMTREPGGSEYAEAIRETALKHPLAKDATPETMLCLMFGSRFDHVAKKVVPAIQSGMHVITDRFDGSSYALNVEAQSLGKLDKTFWSLRGELAVTPDLYIFVDVEPGEGKRRAHLRNGKAKSTNHFDDRDLSFYKRVREGYTKFLKKVKSEHIDANRPIEEVKEDFLKAVRKELCL